MKCPQTEFKKVCPESNDSEKGCPWWTVLIIDGGEKVGRCAISWLPILLIENRLAINKLQIDNKKTTSVSVKRKKR